MATILPSMIRKSAATTIVSALVIIGYAVSVHLASADECHYNGPGNNDTSCAAGQNIFKDGDGRLILALDPEGSLYWPHRWEGLYISFWSSGL
jgi:hypothetical protein